VTVVGGVAVFFIIWWLCLFVILPFSVDKQGRSEPLTPGADPGAPIRPNLIWSAMATTVLAAIIFAGVYVYFGVYQLELQDLLP
jgi:predicted secreted protein